MYKNIPKLGSKEKNVLKSDIKLWNKFLMKNRAHNKLNTQKKLLINVTNKKKSLMK